MTKVVHLASPCAGIRNRVDTAPGVHKSAHPAPTTDSAPRDWTRIESWGVIMFRNLRADVLA